MGGGAKNVSRGISKLKFLPANVAEKRRRRPERRNDSDDAEGNSMTSEPQTKLWRCSRREIGEFAGQIPFPPTAGNRAGKFLLFLFPSSPLRGSDDRGVFFVLFPSLPSAFPFSSPLAGKSNPILFHDPLLRNEPSSSRTQFLFPFLSSSLWRVFPAAAAASSFAIVCFWEKPLHEGAKATGGGGQRLPTVYLPGLSFYLKKII
jgi:hypothetical protein